MFRVVVALCLALATAMVGIRSAPRAEAVYATGGGTYQNSIFWLDWSGGTNFATAADNGGVNPGSFRFKVGTTVTVSPSPNYFITATVVSVGGSSAPNSLGTATGGGGSNNMTMYARGQDSIYSEMRAQGYNTGGARAVISPSTNGGDVTLTVALSATRNGLPVPVDAVFTDGEQANPAQNELIEATTDGTAWEPLFNTNNAAGTMPMWTAGTTNGPNAGYGTQTFGHFFTNGMRVPVAMSRDAKNVQIHIRTPGMQNAMFGILYSADRGDAPTSYGRAAAIQPIIPNAELTTVDPRQYDDNAPDGPRLVSQSTIYFGNGVQPDEDSRILGDPWTGDLLSGDPDESTQRILGTDAFPALSQCMAGYQVRLLATAPDGTPVSGWIDSNNNGVFDTTERAAGTVNGGSVTLTFNQQVRLANSTTGVGSRFWISSEGPELLTPTGTSADGEVADFLIPVTQTCTTSVTKTSNAAATVKVGDVVTYSVAVRNDGTAPFTAGSPASVTDNLAGILDDATYNGDVAVTTSAGTVVPAPTVTGSNLSWSGPLAAGETATITYSVTVTNAGDSVLNNTATIPPGDATTPGANTSNVNDPISAVSLVKSTDPVIQSLSVGQQINYVFTVTNDGASVLNPITITETAFNGTGTPPVATCPSGPLAPGASVNCTASYTVTQGDVDQGSVANTATASGTPEGSTTPVTSTPSTVTSPAEQLPQLELTKTADRQFVTVAGQVITYTYTLRNTGNVTLNTPTINEDEFTGTGPTPVPDCSAADQSLIPGETTTCTATYTVTQADVDAGTLSNTATASATPPSGTPVTSQPDVAQVTTPDVDPVVQPGAQGQPVTLDTNIDPDIVPSSVVFPTTGQPAGSTVSADGRRLTVPGQGEWTIDPATGDALFTPAPGFLGNPTPVLYTGADANGNLAEPATLTVLYPDIENVTGTGDQGQPVTVPADLGPGVDPTSVQLIAPDGSQVSTLVVPGEGTWTVDPVTGAMTFAPAAGFQGDPTPVRYVATDAAGNAALPATVTIDYPDVSDVSGAGNQGAPVTVPPLVDGDTIATTVQYLDPAGNPVSSLTVDGEGVWTIESNGGLTFTPAAGFVGDPTPVEYVGFDADGNQSLPAQVTILYPDVRPVAGSGDEGQPVTVPPSIEAGMDPASVRYVDAQGNRVSQLVVPGEGTWTLQPNGDMTFTPAPGFNGDPTPVLYTAADSAGNFAEPATVTILYPALDVVSGSGDQGEPVTVPPNLEPGMDPTTVQFLDPNGNPTTQLVVPGEGTWTVAPNGDMTFTPQNGFQGNPTPVSYVAQDGEGNRAEPALVTITYPDVSNTSGSGEQGGPVTVPPVVDADTDPTTVQFLDPNGNPTKELVVPGQGTWTVAPNGAMTFTPQDGFVGNPTPVRYVGFDPAGNVSEPALVTITYPNISDVTGSGDQGQPVTVPADYDPGIDPSTVQFLDPAGNPTTRLVVPGQGTWTVAPNGDMTFTPLDGFQGDPTPVRYIARDGSGNLADPATVTVTYPDVGDVAKSGDQGEPVTVTPALEAGMDPTTVRLVDPNGNQVTELVVPGEGTWTVEPDGDIVFTPQPGFQGDPTPVQYTARDGSGNLADPAKVTVTYPNVEQISGSGISGQPVTVRPDLDPGMDPTTVKLVDPNGNMVTTLVVPGEGTWTVEPDGDIVFTPERGFTGNPTPVNYVAEDGDGNLSEPAPVVISYQQPADGPEKVTTPFNTPVTIDPFKNYVPINGSTATPDTSTFQFTPGDGVVVSEDGLTATTDDGVFVYDPSTGLVTFTPRPGFVGETPAIAYTFRDTAGSTTGSTMSVTVSPPPTTPEGPTPTPPPHPKPGLPLTGAQAGVMVPAGVLVMVAVGMFIAVRRRRNLP